MSHFEQPLVSRDEVDATAGRYVNLMAWIVLGVLTGIHALLIM